jgi:hypothetical protein
MVLPTNDHVFENIDDLSLPLTDTMEEGVSNAASKLLGTTLVYTSQLQVSQAVFEVIVLAVLGAPERKVVGVDGIVCRVADQAICRYVLVLVEFMGDGLVELPQTVSICTSIYML